MDGASLAALIKSEAVTAEKEHELAAATI
jgi:hypothetical protein